MPKNQHRFVWRADPDIFDNIETSLLPALKETLD